MSVIRFHIYFNFILFLLYKYRLLKHHTLWKMWIVAVQFAQILFCLLFFLYKRLYLYNFADGFAFSQEEGGAVTQSEVIRAYNTNLPKPGGMWNMNMNGDVLREHRFDIGLISCQSLFSRSAYVTYCHPHTFLEQGMVAFRIPVWTSGHITSLQFAYLSFYITVFRHAIVLCNLMGK